MPTRHQRAPGFLVGFVVAAATIASCGGGDPVVSQLGSESTIESVADTPTSTTTSGTGTAASPVEYLRPSTELAADSPVVVVAAPEPGFHWQLVVDGRGHAWSTGTAGATWWDEASGERITFAPADFDTQLADIEPTSDGGMLFLHRDYSLRWSADGWSRIENLSPYWFENRGSLRTADDGTVWLVANGTSVRRLPDAVLAAPGPHDCSSICTAADDIGMWLERGTDGSLWALTENGVARYSNGEWAQYPGLETTPDRPPYMGMHAVPVAPDRTAYFYTADMLLELSNGAWTKTTLGTEIEGIAWCDGEPWLVGYADIFGIQSGSPSDLAWYSNLIEDEDLSGPGLRVLGIKTVSEDQAWVVLTADDRIGFIWYDAGVATLHWAPGDQEYLSLGFDPSGGVWAIITTGASDFGQLVQLFTYGAGSPS